MYLKFTCVFVFTLISSVVHCNVIRDIQNESNTTPSGYLENIFDNSEKFFENTIEVLQNKTAGIFEGISEILDFGHYERQNGINPFDEIVSEAEKAYENNKEIVQKKTADVFDDITDKLNVWGSEIQKRAENLEESPAIKGAQETFFTFLGSAQTFGLQAPKGIMNLFENGIKEMNVIAEKFEDFAKEKLSLD